MTVARLDMSHVSTTLDPIFERRRAYQRIADAVTAVKGYKLCVERAEQDLVLAVGESLKDAPSLVNDLYWNREVKPSVICAGLGITNSQLRELLDPAIDERTCDCGDVYRVVCRSLAELGARTSCLACEPHQWRGPKRLPGTRDPKRIAELRAMAYASYLRTPEWVATRETALVRAHYCCAICSGKYALQVHHRTYDRLGSEQPRDLIVLCDDCHDLFHKNGRLRR